MTGESKHHHRSGGLRQSNKKNKRSVASKRSVTKRQGGRVNAVTAKRANTAAANGSSSNKWNRRNQQKQLRLQKRSELISQKLGGVSSISTSRNGNEFSNEKPSRMVGIISLSSIHSSAAHQMEHQVRQNIAAIATTTLPSATSATCCHFAVHKKDGYLTFLTASKQEDDEDAAVLAALDMARMCDTILFILDDASTPANGDVPVASIQINSHRDTDQSTLRSTGNESAWDHLVSSRGDRILAAVKGQGLPTPITVVAKASAEHLNDGQDMDAEYDHDMDMMTVPSMSKSIHRSIWKRRADLKKYATRFATSEFGTTHNKVFELVLQSNPDQVLEKFEPTETASATVLSSMAPSKSNPTAAALVRSLCTMNCHPPLWISQSSRPYIINESQSFSYDPSLRTLSLTGSIRSWNGVPLDVNALYHIPGIGTVACHSIQKAVSPWQQHRLQRSKNGMDTAGVEVASSFIHADPDKRESLNMYATPDALDGEQNLIGFDEDDEEDHDNMNNEVEEKGASRPAGWSDYQSAWIDSVNDDFNDNETTDDNGIDHGELAQELNRKRSSNDTIATNGMDMDDGDFEVSEEERQSLLEQRRRQHKEETDFPDEVQVPEDIKARDRFARYRSLKSFRKSPWDAKENLPDSYATIFHFSSFKQTQRSVLNDMTYLAREAAATQCSFFGKTLSDSNGDNDEMTDDIDEDVLEGCVPSGVYVSLTFENVPPETINRMAPDAVLAAVALLPHENKVSVMHMGLSQTLGCDATNSEYPVKSKDVLTFRCGWRTWQARPVFSQNNLNCDKHKFERFLPTGGAFFAASVFGPVTYTPCPVLVFREKSPNNEQRQLVAIGSILGADADRIVVKRIVLTGYPVRVHKRHATVKYMFYDPEDVKWFKPAGLHTKHGLQGNIIQSVGEHGTMKCLFNAPIKQHDTVCLPLYKRIYPKYATPLNNRDIEEKSRSGVTTYRETKPNLIVL